MNTFNKKSLYAAMAGLSALGVTGVAQAVSVNPDGLGQALHNGPPRSGDSRLATRIHAPAAARGARRRVAVVQYESTPAQTKPQVPMQTKAIVRVRFSSR